MSRIPLYYKICNLRVLTKMDCYKNTVYLMIGCLIISSSFLLENANGQGFRAAATKVDITPPADAQKWLLGYPPRQSTGIMDHIFHRIVVLDNGSNKFILISSDLCYLDPSVTDKLRDKIKNEFENKNQTIEVWWGTTHGHSEPEVGPAGLPDVFMPDRYHHEVDADYTTEVENKLIKGIEEANNNLIPARLGVGWGYSSANMNRRAIGVDGKASLGMNPDKPVDRKIGLIRIDGRDGRGIALIANYAMHGTVLNGRNTLITGDAPGIVAEYVQDKIGVPMLYMNGAAGNMAPLYSTYDNASAGHLDQFKVLLGDKILDTYKKIHPNIDTLDLKTGVVTVETPRRDGLGWPEYISDYTRRTSTGQNMVLLPISFLRINKNIALWSAPVEMFCEIAMSIRDQSPFEYTFYFGYTNGWLGYLPTKEAFKEHGYEVDVVSPYTPVVEEQVKETVTAYLQGELRSR